MRPAAHQQADFIDIGLIIVDDPHDLSFIKHGDAVGEIEQLFEFFRDENDAGALVAQFDPGRKDRDTSTLNPTPGDKRLSGMGNVRASTEAGVAVGYGPVTLVARQSLGERGHKGAQADLTVEFPWSLSDRFGLRFAVGATWADRDYMQAYFGVTAAQAQATSFSVYTPKSGLRKVDASVGAEYAMAPSWKLQANFGVSALGDDAAASPLVGRRAGASAALAVAYEF